MFFVATAATVGRINLSPNGFDAVRVLGLQLIAWPNLGGSGNETHAHLAIDCRIILTFCNFQRPALILRVYGRGVSVLPQDADWEELTAHFTLQPGTRQIFDIAVASVQTSCGWGVPAMTLVQYHCQANPETWKRKILERTRSIDGLPSRPSDHNIAGK